MTICQVCHKGIRKVSYSRHKKGSSGAGGNWALRGPIHVRLQKPNLHKFHGMILCSSCLKTLKHSFTKDTKVETPEAVQA